MTSNTAAVSAFSLAPSSTPLFMLSTGKKMNRDEAARTILHTWREASRRKSLVKKFRAELLVLPHRKFMEAWRYTYKPLLNDRPLQKKSREAMVEIFQKEREAFETRFCYVICTDVGSSTELPKYYITTTLPEDAERLPDSTVYLTKSAKEQYAAMKKSPPQNKKELDDLVQTLSGREDLFPWNFTRRGCLPKAMVTSDIFALCGVPRENLRLRFVRLPEDCRVKPFDHWQFHVSVEVLTADKNWLAVDCTLSPFKANDHRSWIKLQQNPALRQEPQLVELRTNFAQVPKGLCFTCPYDGKKVMTFTIPTHMTLDQITDKEITVGHLNPPKRDTALKKLAAYRFELERRMITANTQVTL